jgi:hypothetical protein
MAEHSVKVRLPKRIDILSKDLEVQVKSNGKILGTLKISKGSLDWKDASDQKPHVLGWTKFVRLVKGEGKKKHKR